MKINGLNITKKKIQLTLVHNIKLENWEKNPKHIIPMDFEMELLIMEYVRYHYHIKYENNENRLFVKENRIIAMKFTRKRVIF